MKYILMMTGTKAGVDAYKAWSEKDIQAHFAHLKDTQQGADRVRRVCGQ